MDKIPDLMKEKKFQELFSTVIDLSLSEKEFSILNKGKNNTSDKSITKDYYKITQQAKFVK